MSDTQPVNDFLDQDTLSESEDVENFILQDENHYLEESSQEYEEALPVQDIEERLSVQDIEERLSVQDTEERLPVQDIEDDEGSFFQPVITHHSPGPIMDDILAIESASDDDDDHDITDGYTLPEPSAPFNQGPRSRHIPSHPQHQPHPLSDEGSTQVVISSTFSPVDSQGVTRGSCTVVDCTCTQYGKQPHGNKCGNCGHFPVKHISVKLPLKDDSQPAAGQYTDHYSGQTIQTSQSLVAQSKNTSLAAAAELPGSTTTANKCAITECYNPRYVDPSTGALHTCCGYTHAMEHQRRQAIQSGPVQKGITHCLLPECSNIVWPFMNYCCKTHADTGRQRGLMPPMPDLTNVDTSSKDTNTCWFPTCSKQRFKEPNGRIHLYCGKTHADMARKANLKIPDAVKCIIPGCNQQKYSDGTVSHSYCSKTCAEEGKRRGIFPQADSKENECSLDGCNRPKYREGSITFDYCSKEHANKAATNILKSRSEVDAFLKQYPILKVIRITENPSAMPHNGALFQKFQSAWKQLPSNSGQRNTILAFHGTPEGNIQSICNNGYDPSRRKGQAYGAGEYFAVSPSTPLGYCHGGKKILLNELLLGQHGTHHTRHGDIVVMKNPAHDLPRFIIEFQ